MPVGVVKVLKDFIPVDKEEGAVSEIEFIERYWSGKLKGNLRNLETELKRRDEYRVMEPYLRTFHSGAKILDGGCGAGEWTVFLAGQGYNVTGLDISELLVTRLSAIFPGSRYIRGDLRKMGLDDACMDAMISWGAFEHCEAGVAPYLIEARRVVRPGGFLFFSVPYANRRQLKHRGGGGSEVQPEGMRFYQWRFAREDLRKELEKCSWDSMEIVPIHKEHGLWRMLKADYHIDFSWLPTFQKWCLKLLGLFVSADYVSHMLMVVARRPEQDVA